MTTTSARDSAGFTLVEVMCAIVVMTVGLLGLLQSVNVAYEHNARNKLREEAVQLAEEEMNRFRLMRFENVTATNATSSVAREVVGVTKDFRVTRECETMGDSKKLTVHVAWQFRNVTTQHVIYTMKNK
jgi:type IV pilus assembly protein PilV